MSPLFEAGERAFRFEYLVYLGMADQMHCGRGRGNGALQLLINPYGSIRFAQVPERRGYFIHLGKADQMHCGRGKGNGALQLIMNRYGSIRFA